MKLKVPTIPAASVAFGFLAVKTFVPVLPAPPAAPLGLLAPPLAPVHAGTNEVELGARLLTFMLNAKVESRVMRMIENNKFLQVGLVIFIYFN